MKTREEQIAEMAKAMGDFELKDTVKCDIELSEHLFAKGYRKQSDTVREFVKRLKKELFAKCTYILTVDNPNDYDMKSDEVNALIDELAEEYGAEVEQ